MSRLFHTWRGASLTACFALLFVPLLFVSPLQSHDPITTKLTWTQEISRIVDKRCASCHRPGGKAFSLTTYADARPWAKAIRDQVASRRMPPWGAVKGVGDFKDDPSLSAPEMDMLIAWVEGGAPEGDPAFLAHAHFGSAAAEPAPRYASSIRVAHETTLARAASLVALKPQSLSARQSLEAWAVLPDSNVIRLIWLRDYQAAWTRDYVLRKPIPLPAGTRLRVEAAGHAGLLFRFHP